MTSSSPTPSSAAEPVRASCDECRKRKLRCTPERGGCARCTARGLSCTFSARKRMGRPRTVNRPGSDRSRQSTVLPPTPPTEYDPEWSPPMDLGEFEWLMSPSASASATESPMTVPLPSFLDLDPALWGEPLGFPAASPPLPYSPPLPSAKAQISASSSSAAHLLSFPALQTSPSGLGIQAPAPDAEPAEPSAACFCTSTALIESLRSTLRSPVHADGALHAASSASAMCARSRRCSVCAADPSTPIAAFTVLSLVAQILGCAVAAWAPARVSDKDVSETAPAPGAPGEDCEPRGADRSGMAVPPGPVDAVQVRIGAFTLPADSARRVLRVALQEEVRRLRSAAAELELGELLDALGRQLGDMERRLATELDSR